MKRLILLALATTLSAAAIAQTWKNSYQAGLDAVQDGKWADAREDFQVASREKSGDLAKGVVESSNGFQKTYWRNGAPYSPNFLAAYAGLKEALLLSGASRTYLLKQVAAEFEAVLASGEYCVETFFFLDETYVLLPDPDKRVALGKQYNDLGSAMTWKIDLNGIDPADRELLAQLPPPKSSTAKQTPKPTRPVMAPQTTNATPAVFTAVSPQLEDVTSTPSPKPQAPPAQQPQSPAPGTSTPKTQAATPVSLSTPSVQTKAAGPTASGTGTLPPATPETETKFPAAMVAVQPNPTVSKNTAAKTPKKEIPASSTAAAVPQVQDKIGQQHLRQPDPTPAPTTTLIVPPPPSSQGITPNSQHLTASDNTQGPTSNAQGQKPKRHKGKNDPAPVPDTAVAFTGVAPIEIKKIEHPAQVKVSAKSDTTVPGIPTKYALIIGNSESKMDGGAMPFAGDDAQMVRQALVENAGYLDQNIEVVINATSEQIASTVNALSSRVGDKGTVLIYFSGVGASMDGKDYLAGVDSDVTNDSSTMIAKDDIYKAFMLKGARVFAFYQCNRPIVDGHFFGSEYPLVGSISQMQATLPGQSVFGINTGGSLVGLFTNGFVSTLKTIRSNQTPIMDFGWQLFYTLRRGDTGEQGGSSNQSPSLPVVTNMAADARF
jgi:hypothetical protein